MKNIIFILLTITILFSCKEESSYVTFSGKITNQQHTDSLIIFHPNINFSKIIKVKNDGTFKDTLKVENGLFTITNGKNFTLLYLLNGDNIVMNFNENNFYKTINFNGNHAKENNFLATSVHNEELFFSDTNLMFLPKAEFDNKLNNYVDNFNTRLSEKTFDTDFLKHQKEEIDGFKEYTNKEYLEKNYTKLVLGKGKPSPKFLNYESYKGDNVSLEDFKKKYVYIDLWATWCRPCTNEFPYLKKIEEQYANKNIAFVSISLDNKKDYTTWKSMVENRELGGTQLFANEDRNFTSAYKVRSIPRFILIDPNGNIINANAPRPSSPQLKTLLQTLNL